MEHKYLTTESLKYNNYTCTILLSLMLNKVK